MKIRHYTNVLIALLIFVIALSAYGAWYSRIGEESAQAVSLTTQIQTKTQTAARTASSKEELEKALSNESTIKTYFIDTNDVVPFLESLQSVGSRLGAAVEVLSVSAQPQKPRTVLLLNLSITGPFDSVEKTLGAIEYQPYDTTITSVTLDTPGGAQAVWTAAVTLKIGTTQISSSTPKAAKP